MNLNAPLTRVTKIWRGSLQLRATVYTVALTLIAVLIAGVILQGNISSGLEEARLKRALAEIEAGRSIARTAAQRSTETDDRAIVNELVGDLGRRAGEPPVFEVVLIPRSGGSGLPEASTALTSSESIPPAMIDVVDENKTPVWLDGEIAFADGRSEEGIIVGAPVNIKELGGYELFYLWPSGDVAKSLNLVRNAILLVGGVLVVVLGGLAWLLTRRIVRPLQETAVTAQAIAQGDLGDRVEIRGEDEMAQLGASFNKMADSLADQIGKLQDLTEKQRQFVSDVAHELRTPLTTIRMAADVSAARVAADDPVAVRSSHLLVAEAERFDQLLADLLEVSRFDAGAVELEKTETDLGQLIRSQCEQLSGLAAAQDVALTLRLADDVVIAVDDRRIARIIRNLVTNAIEYGEGKPVSVSLTTGPDLVEVAVADAGPGVPPEYRESVFERFWRADPARTRTLGGTGLGLAISRADARLHGGDVEIRDSELGALFVLTLPRQ